MKENFPNVIQEINPNELDGAEVLEIATNREGFDSEAVWRDAGKQLEAMLDAMEIDPTLPVEFIQVAKLEKLLAEDLNPSHNPAIDNSMRFVAMAASAMYDKALREDLSQRQFEDWSTFKMKKRMKDMMEMRGIVAETPEMPEAA